MILYFIKKFVIQKTEISLLESMDVNTIDSFWKVAN